MGFTQLKLLCFSPFGVDGSRNVSSDDPFVRSYGFLNSISGAIAEAQGKPDAIKLIELEPGQNPGKVAMGRYIFDFTPVSGARGGAAGEAAQATPPSQGRGGAATSAQAAPPAAARGGSVGLSFLDKPFVLIVNTAPNEYYFASNASFPFVALPNNIPNARVAAPAIMERGAFKNGVWVMQRRVNGDDIMGRGYDVSAESTTTCPAPRYRSALKPEAVVAPLTPRPSRRPYCALCSISIAKWKRGEQSMKLRLWLAKVHPGLLLTWLSIRSPV